MANVAIKSRNGGDAGTIELDDALFGVTPNVPVMHQVVTAQLANRRSGTQSTLTRAEVRGGGAKPWRQKGTGRARQGSIRAPHWQGGGVALGPKPRSYHQRTPKKMIRLALLGALSDRAATGNVVVVDGWGFERPSTKQAGALLASIGVSGKVLVVVSAEEITASKSFRNIPNVHVLLNTELNAYDVLCSDYVVFTPETLPNAKPNDKGHVAAAEAPAATPVKVAKPAKAAKAAAVEAPADAEEDTEAQAAEPTQEGSD